LPSPVTIVHCNSLLLISWQQGTGQWLDALAAELERTTTTST